MRFISRPRLLTLVALISLVGLSPGCRSGETEESGLGVPEVGGVEGAGSEVPEAWTQWRGAGRDAVIHEFSPPVVWPEALNLEWSTEVGAGYSSPIASETAAFIHTRAKESELVSALSLETGEVLWADSYPALSTKAPEFAQIEGEGPYATPVLHAGRLHTVGVQGVVSTYEADTGELLWRRDFSDLIVETQRFCGVASSPLIADDQLVVQIGDDDSGEVMALDPVTGETFWTWASPATSNASPNVVELGGVRQIVTMTDEGVVGLGIADGSLLWQHPFPGVQGSCSTNIPSPVVADNAIILAAMVQGSLAIEVSLSEDGWTTRRLWKNDDLEPLWSNLVFDAGELFGVLQKRKGQLFSADAQTGTLQWSTEGRSGENGFTVVIGDVVLFLMNEGELIIARRTRPGLELEHRYTVADAAVWSYPVPLDGGILVKAGSTLSRWSFN
jgi:outer membrane protein assembly factor BamB